MGCSQHLQHLGYGAVSLGLAPRACRTGWLAARAPLLGGAALARGFRPASAAAGARPAFSGAVCCFPGSGLAAVQANGSEPCVLVAAVAVPDATTCPGPAGARGSVRADHQALQEPFQGAAPAAARLAAALKGRGWRAPRLVRDGSCHAAAHARPHMPHARQCAPRCPLPW